MILFKQEVKIWGKNSALIYTRVRRDEKLISMIYYHIPLYFYLLCQSIINIMDNKIDYYHKHLNTKSEHQPHLQNTGPVIFVLVCAHDK